MSKFIFGPDLLFALIFNTLLITGPGPVPDFSLASTNVNVANQ
jgi:hypothetical protein